MRWVLPQGLLARHHIVASYAAERVQHSAQTGVSRPVVVEGDSFLDALFSLHAKTEAFGSIDHKFGVDVHDRSTGGIRLEAVSRHRTAGCSETPSRATRRPEKGRREKTEGVFKTCLPTRRRTQEERKKYRETQPNYVTCFSTLSLPATQLAHTRFLFDKTRRATLYRTHVICGKDIAAHKTRSQLCSMVKLNRRARWRGRRACLPRCRDTSPAITCGNRVGPS